MKNIKFAPRNPRPDDWPIVTNIGEFSPGEIHVVAFSDRAEAQRLVDNGEFYLTDEPPTNQPTHTNDGVQIIYATEPKMADEQDGAAARVPFRPASGGLKSAGILPRPRRSGRIF
jgi:hypothetical protein